MCIILNISSTTQSIEMKIFSLKPLITPLMRVLVATNRKQSLNFITPDCRYALLPGLLGRYDQSNWRSSASHHALKAASLRSKEFITESSGNSVINDLKSLRTFSTKLSDLVWKLCLKALNCYPFQVFFMALWHLFYPSLLCYLPISRKSNPKTRTFIC